MKFGICNEIFKGWSIDRTIDFVEKTGYDALEIAPFTVAQDVTHLSSSQRQEIRRKAEEAGLAISGLHWVLVQTEGLHLTHPDPAVRRSTAHYFCDLVKCSADLGGKIIVVGSPKQRSLIEGVSYEQAWEFARETFAPSVKLAGEQGVTICLEPLAPSETNFINTAEEAVRFIQQFDHPNFKIILDVKAMSSESKPIPQIIRESWPHFAYFHANDKNLKGPGFGEVDFRPIAGALKEVGYNGYVSVEVFDFTEGPEVIAEKSLAHLKQVFGQTG